MLLFTNTITPRLRYIADFTGNELLGRPFDLTTDIEFFTSHTGPKINYSNREAENCLLSIYITPLLFETGIRKQNPVCFTVNGFKAFFKTEGDYPFDIFAAAFYLLSRYEEYLPYQKDIYGRYAHENSLAFKEGFLHLPLVNIWLEDFKKTVKKKFPDLSFRSSAFSFLPTYDIDEAYAYLHKGFVRTAGGIARQFVTGDWAMMKERVNVLRRKDIDPYDAYGWLDELHKQYRLRPLFFIHAAAENGKYDKNILPSNTGMQNLIKKLAEKYSIGIHPSWRSGDEDRLLQQEINTLETISGKKITSSRQHYIRFSLPGTFSKLAEAGITDDYSMGYGSINGFRASVASSFFWYNMEQEEQTALLLHPFCFMETNSFYEQKHLPQRAFEEMMGYYHTVKSIHGRMISIWHNSFLGPGKKLSGWKDIYRQFIAEISTG